MLVKEIMTDRPDYVDPEMNLVEVAKEMRQFDFGFLPVGENDRLIGTITDRDLVTRALAEGWDLKTKHARDVMTPEVLYCFDDDTIEAAAENMSRNHIHRLIVLDHNKRLKGILSLDDIAKGCSDEALCGHTLKCICEEV